MGRVKNSLLSSSSLLTPTEIEEQEKTFEEVIADRPKSSDTEFENYLERLAVEVRAMRELYLTKVESYAHFNDMVKREADSVDNIRRVVDSFSAFLHMRAGLISSEAYTARVAAIKDKPYTAFVQWKEPKPPKEEKKRRYFTSVGSIDVDASGVCIGVKQ